jgi:hypothetical protein
MRPAGGLGLARSILLVVAALSAVAGCAQTNGGPTNGGPTNASPTIASPTSGDATYELRGHVAAGPTCPVEPASPLPGQCEPRPVVGAILVVSDATGREVARITSSADGSFVATLPPGRYTITPQPVEGLLGVAPPVEIDLGPGQSPVALAIEYDTGIR